ncbi:MAG: hypothetical protein DI585_02260 [Pseudomonas fluorescens]|nr:MAG: hypothetical protein DI585_02260 [Pseudomonas fluorescens]
MRYLPSVLTVALLTLAHGAQAQESLLWKAVSKQPAAVVPAYNGEASPFPTRVAAVSNVSESSALEEEAARLRNAAFEEAQAVIASGRGVEPYTAGIRVGGVLEGMNGRKVLVANRWLGVGAVLPVRVTRSNIANEAIRNLASYDATASADLSRRLDSEIGSNPTTPLTLREIRKESLVFDSKYGRKAIDFKMKSE